MKPCSKNRKRIAWLAVDALDAQEATALRDHLAHCDACRRYREEISNVTQGLAAVKPDSQLEASEVFHQRVARKLQATESSSVLQNLATWLRGWRLNWRVALPVSAVLVMAFVAMVALRNPPSPRTPLTAQLVPASGPESDLAPTIANYQRMANQSLEKLSDLLTKQGNKPLPPAPIYGISSFELANSSY